MPTDAQDTETTMTAPSTTARTSTTPAFRLASACRGLFAAVFMALFLTHSLSAQVSPSTSSPLEVLVADFNHDGIPDALIPSSTGPTATIAFGSVPYGIFSSNPKAVTVTSPCADVANGGVYLGNIVAADFNGDGIPDLFFNCLTSTSTLASATSVMLGKGDGTFGPPVILNAPYAAGGIAGDFNRDGKQDLVLVSYPAGYSGTNNQHPVLLFFAGNGDGTFASPVTSSLGTSPTFEPGDFLLSSPVAADVDGDGYPDILLNAAYGYTSGNYNGATLTVSVFGNKRDGTFGAASGATRLPDATSAAGTYPASLDRKVIAGHFSSSALPSFVVPDSGTGSPGLFFIPNTSTSGSFSFGTPVKTPYPGIQTAAVANFSNSGLADLAVANGTAVAALVNDGASHFAATYSSLTIPTASTLFAVADANGDGYSDLFTANLNNSTYLALAINLVSGSATATSQPVTLPVGNTTITAAWPGNLNYLGSSTEGTQVVTLTPTTVGLAGTPNPATTGAAVTLTAIVASTVTTTRVPTGTVTFTDGATALGSADLDSTGTATLTISSLAAGTHSIQASYPGDAFFAPSTGTFTQNVTAPGQLTGNLLLNPGAELRSLQYWNIDGPGTPTVDTGTFDPGINPHTGTYDFLGHDGASSALTQNVSIIVQGVTADMVDTGTLRAALSFWEQGLNQGTPSDDASVTLSFRDSDGGMISSVNSGEIDSHVGAWQNFSNSYPIPPGTRAITYSMNFIRHQGSDLDAFVDDNSLLILAAAAPGATPTLTWTAPASIPYGTPLSAAQLNAVATDSNGAAIPGVYTYTPAAGTILPVGTQTLSLLFTPTDSSAYTSATATVPIIVTPVGTTATLAITSGSTPVTSIAQGAVITLTATVVSGTSPVTPGQVNFCDASATACTDVHLVGPAQLSPTGTATVRIIPGAGTRSYKAVFLGTTNALAASSAAATVTVSALYPTATTVAQSGSAGNYTLTATVTGTGGTSAPTGTVTFSNTTNANMTVGNAALGAATPTFSFTNPANPATGSQPIGVVPYDLNGDGKKDLVVNNSSSNTLSILLGNGDGTFTAAPDLTTGRYPASVAVGDFNNDGFPDIAVTNFFDNNLSIFLGHGDGTFTAAASPQTGEDTRTVVTADFNRDGKLDLAVGHDNLLTILLGNGDGTFTATTVSPATGNGPNYGIAAGDLNGDGIPDIAVTNAYENTISILLGNGDGTFSAMPKPATGSTPVSLALGDVNGDGKLDIVVADQGDNNVTILLGNGDGTFALLVQPSVGNNPQGVSIGDFDGDGIPDLATANEGDSTVTILRGKGDGTFSLATSQAAGASPDRAAIADFNGDGTPDIATSNVDGGGVSILLTSVTRTATATATGINPVGSGAQQIVATYPGSVLFSSSTSTPTALTGTPAGTMTTVIGAPNPATVGSAITFTATVSHTYAQIPTGTVRFTDGTSILGTATLTAAGTASLTSTALTIGTHAIAATYMGDATFATSTSTPFSQVVKAAQGLTLSTTTLVFGNQTANTRSAAQSVTVTNNNTVNVNIAAILLILGPAPSDYAQTNNCPAALLPGAACTINISFTPHGVGLKSAGVEIDTDSTPSQQSINLTGTGTGGILQVDPGNLKTIAGTGTAGYSGDNGVATAAQLNLPGGVAVDATGAVYIADELNSVVRKVSASGTISTFAGTGVNGYTGDGGPATAAQLKRPTVVLLDTAGNLYITDAAANVVRKVSTTGIISTFAGTGTAGRSGDGGQAASARLNQPQGAHFDRQGNLYLALCGSSSVRKIDTSGIITTVAGNFTPGFSGDGGPATSAQLYCPSGVDIDAAGNLYIADDLNNRIRKVSPSGIITTIAGDGTAAYNGESISAATAELNLPNDVALDAAGNLYIADSGNNRVRKIDTAGTITTVAGGLQNAGSAIVNTPLSLTIAPSGSLYFVDSGNNAVRQLFPTGTTPFAATRVGSSAAPQTLTISNIGNVAVTIPSAQSFTLGANAADFALTGGSCLASNTVLAVGGACTLQITFTPTAVGSRLLTVGIADTALNSPQSFMIAGTGTIGTPTIIWPTPAAIPYGTPLSTTQLNASANGAVGVSLPGIFTYTPAAGTVLPAGAQSLSVTFTPTDAVDYTTASATNTITVTQAVPTLAWATPAAISAGTALSSTQLNATATGVGGAALPGTFTYTPAAGTVPAAGTQTLSVTFTPADAVDYTTVSRTVQLQVNGITLTAITPSTASLGDPNKTITLTGTGFTTGVVAQVNGTRIATTFVNATTLTATVPAANFAAPGTLAITVANPAISTVTASLPLTVTAPTASVTLTGPSTTTPGTQPTVALNIVNPYPIPLTASFSLTFNSSVTPAVDDPSIQFAGGGRTFTFTVPANSTTVPAIQLQAGTVAGTITVPLTLTAAGVNVTPTTLQPLTITVPAAVPTVSAATITRDGAQFTVVIHGFSNTREVAKAAFHFVAATGAAIDTPDVTIPVTTIFSGWFTSTPSVQYGSTFTYTQVFNVSDTSASIGSVQVTLTNSAGVSTLYTAQ